MQAIAGTGKVIDKAVPKITSIRPFFNRGQAATLTVTAEDAERLTRERRVRVGLCLCRIEERLEPLRCYRC